MIKHYIGIAEYPYSQQNKTIPVYYVPEQLINGHLLLCGMSGTGKSTQSIRLLNSVRSASIDIFDAHEELEVVRDAVACKYSQRTRYGYNPLVIDTDLDDGGVQQQVNFIVDLVKTVTPGFGVRQEAVLRNLLTDVYIVSGIMPDKPATWSRAEMTEDMREEFISNRQWAELKRFYPTLEDIKTYGRRKIIALTIGGDNKAITAFEALRRAKQRLHMLLGKYNKTADRSEVERLEGQIQSQKEDCIDSYSVFVAEMKTGREIDDILKYDSVDTLTSVLSRLDVLMSSGILRSNPPPFGNARVRCHQIKSLDDSQQVLFVKLRLKELFKKYKQIGKTVDGSEIRHVVFLDEAHKFFTDDPKDIINVIAKEGRKFGLALWCAAQEPTAFPESFLTNCGATFLLGVHSAFWKRTTNLLRITEPQLKYIKGKEVIAIKLQRSGAADPQFVHVVVPNPASSAGQEAGRIAV